MGEEEGGEKTSKLRGTLVQGKDKSSLHGKILKGSGVTGSGEEEPSRLRGTGLTPNAAPESKLRGKILEELKRIKDAYLEKPEKKPHHEATTDEEHFEDDKAKEVLSRDNICVAETLYVDHDEDGPPIAWSQTIKSPEGVDIKTGFVSVADGMGGAGSYHVIDNTDRKEKSMAYIASRKAQKAAENLFASNPSALTGTLTEVRESLEKSLKASFDSIDAEKMPSGVKGTSRRDYPTTFSAGVVQETSEGKRVMLFWAGDSPLLVYTPNKIYTTTSSADAGDAPLDSLIAPNRYGLHSSELIFPSDTPILVTAASDGVLKLGRDQLQTAVEFILGGVKNNPHDRVGDNLKKEYQIRKEIGGVEIDDTTIAMVGSMKPGDTSRLNASVPIETIYPARP